MARQKREKTVVTACFAEKLDECMRRAEENSKTQKQIASEIGISDSMLFDYRNDYKTPTIDTLCKICSYFDVSADYLLTGVKTENREIAKYTGLSDEAIEVLHQVSTSTNIFHKQWLPIINRLFITKRFWENIMTYLDRAYRIKKGIDKQINDEQMEEKIKSACNLIKLNNTAGYTHDVLFNGNFAADVHIQIAADDTKILYKAIIDQLVGGEKDGQHKANGNKGR